MTDYEEYNNWNPMTGNYRFSADTSQKEAEERKKKQEKEKKEEFEPKFKVMGRGKERLSLDYIVGQETAKYEAKKFIKLLKNRNLCKMYGLRFPNLLFYGSAGTGKTFLAEVMAFESRHIEDTIFLSLNLQDFASSFINRTANNFVKTIEYIAKGLKQREIPKDYAVVFIDEFDSIGRQRGADMTSSENDKLVNAVNTHLDGDRGIPEISYIAATNFYDLIDFSQKSRFSTHIKFEDFKYFNEIEELIKVHCDRAQRKTSPDMKIELFESIDYLNIAKRIEGNVSGREVRDIVDRAIAKKVYEIAESDKIFYDNMGINNDYFDNVVSDYNIERKVKGGIGF